MTSLKLLDALETKLQNELANAHGALQRGYAERKRLQDAQNRAVHALREQERALATPALRIDCQLHRGALAYLLRLDANVRSCADACAAQEAQLAIDQQKVLAFERKRAVLEQLRRGMEQQQALQFQRLAQKQADNAWIARANVCRLAAQEVASC